MRLLRRSSLIALTVAAIAGTPTVAESRSHTMTPGTHIVRSIGSFDTTRTRRYAPTIARATRAFGKPSSRVRRFGGCVVKWKRLGLRIDFHNFGGTPPGQTICGPDASYAQSFSATPPAVVPVWDGGAYAVVSAHVRGTRVSSLRGWIGAAGEQLGQAPRVRP